MRCKPNIVLSFCNTTVMCSDALDLLSSVHKKGLPLDTPILCVDIHKGEDDFPTCMGNFRNCDIMLFEICTNDLYTVDPYFDWRLDQTSDI